MLKVRNKHSAMVVFDTPDFHISIDPNETISVPASIGTEMLLSQHIVVV